MRAQRMSEQGQRSWRRDDPIRNLARLRSALSCECSLTSSMLSIQVASGASARSVLPSSRLTPTSRGSILSRGRPTQQGRAGWHFGQKREDVSFQHQSAICQEDLRQMRVQKLIVADSTPVPHGCTPIARGRELTWPPCPRGPDRRPPRHAVADPAREVAQPLRLIEVHAHLAARCLRRIVIVQLLRCTCQRQRDRSRASRPRGATGPPTDQPTERQTDRRTD